MTHVPNTSPPVAQPMPTGLDTHAPLAGVAVLSLALNLPGPAAVQRLVSMGATCTKLEPPSGDPMRLYEPQAYKDMHQGIAVHTLDLKTPEGQQQLHTYLAQTDVLLTAFRPSALAKLGLEWPALHARHPHLNLVTVVGAPGDRAEEPGHDLTYLAEHDLVQGLNLPATLYADMAGALMASEAVLGALVQRQRGGQGVQREVALSAAAGWLAQPRRWGLTQVEGDVGGAHAGYRVYACHDGRVAVAALEPHFARRLWALVCPSEAGVGAPDMHQPSTHAALTRFFADCHRQQLDEWAKQHDLPLHTLC